MTHHTTMLMLEPSRCGRLFFKPGMRKTTFHTVFSRQTLTPNPSLACERGEPRRRNTMLCMVLRRLENTVQYAFSEVRP